MTISFKKKFIDLEWGCAHQEVISPLATSNIKICFVEVENLTTLAEKLNSLVLDTSWMTSLDKGIRRQYDYTVKETAGLLIEIFKAVPISDRIGEEFGEVMVSIGSARGLEQIFRHIRIPIAELWKPQAKQNEGFDFHTTCTSEFVNFGEAKFSGSANPHGLAMKQAARFISEQKHLRDRAHLVNFVNKTSIDLLDDDGFGVIAAFSINSATPLDIFKNALKTAIKFTEENDIHSLYLVGVNEKCPSK